MPPQARLSDMCAHGNAIVSGSPDTIVTGMPEGGRGHAFYGEWRRLPPDTPEAKAIAAESRAYDNAVRGAGGGGE